MPAQSPELCIVVLKFSLCAKALLFAPTSFLLHKFALTARYMEPLCLNNRFRSSHNVDVVKVANV